MLYFSYSYLQGLISQRDLSDNCYFVFFFLGLCTTECDLSDEAPTQSFIPYTLTVSLINAATVLILIHQFPPKLCLNKNDCVSSSQSFEGPHRTPNRRVQVLHRTNEARATDLQMNRHAGSNGGLSR